MNRLYLSLEKAKRAAVSTVGDPEDERVMDLIRAASKWLEAACRPRSKLTNTPFYPIEETREFDHAWDTERLKLDQWLLNISAFTTNNGATPVAAADYYLLHHDTYNRTPYNLIEMRPDGGVPALLYTEVAKANSITGEWGYSNNLADTGIETAEALNAVDTVFNVDEGDGIETGWMIRINDEQMFVSSRASGILTVIREQGGTTPATHSSGAAISRYVPPADIESACWMIVGRLYHRTATEWSDTLGSPDQGILFFKDMPVEAQTIVRRYRDEWMRTL